MSEPFYSIACWFIRLSPLLAMVAAWVIHWRQFNNKYGFISAAITGYIVGLLAVIGYWDFAIKFAPNEAMSEELAMKDGAPLSTAPFVMPIFVLLSFVVVAPLSLLICNRIRMNSKRSPLRNPPGATGSDSERSGTRPN